MLVVDPASDDDLRSVARLAREALSEMYAEEWLEAHLHNHQVLVARDLAANQVVGFAVADRSGPCEGHLAALAVDRFHRRRGVGSALLRGVQDHLVRGGAYRLQLEVRADDPEAKAFYTRHGFSPEGLMDHAYRDGASAVRYARPL
jgi:[ribosomal protein S18]-alanine N-acetyltransferase